MKTLEEKFQRQTNELSEKEKQLSRLENSFKEKSSTQRQLEHELGQVRNELKITVERLRQMETDQHAQLTESESTTNYLERRIHDLDKVREKIFASKRSSARLDDSPAEPGQTTDDAQIRS